MKKKSILKECNEILRQAKKLKGESYLFFPDGLPIPRAKGHIEITMPKFDK